MGLARGGDLIEPVAVGDPGAHRAQRAKDPRQGFDPAGVIDPEQLALGSRGVGERTEQVEQGAKTLFLADRRHMAHGAVVGHGEQEAEAGFVERPALLLGRGGNVDAESQQDVSRPRF